MIPEFQDGASASEELRTHFPERLEKVSRLGVSATASGEQDP